MQALLIGNSCLETRLQRCSSDDGDAVEEGEGADGQKDICVGSLHFTGTLACMRWTVAECLDTQSCLGKELLMAY